MTFRTTRLKIGDFFLGAPSIVPAMTVLSMSGKPICARRGISSTLAGEYPILIRSGVKRLPMLIGGESQSRGRELDYLALPVHHKTLPTMRHSDSEVNEMESYSRWSETRASV